MTTASRKTDKLLQLLASGKNVSVAQIRKRTKLTNPYSTIARLRSYGFRIYTNRKQGLTYYRLGV